MSMSTWLLLIRSPATCEARATSDWLSCTFDADRVLLAVAADDAVADVGFPFVHAVLVRHPEGSQRAGERGDEADFDFFAHLGARWTRK